MSDQYYGVLVQGVGLLAVTDVPRDETSASLALTEYAYYFVVFYTVLGAALDLLLMGNIGSGFLLIPVLVSCFAALGGSLLTVLRTIWLPIACGVSHLFIQLAVHGESLYGMYVYQFGPWLISLIIVQSLAMHRPGFLHRFAWFTLLIGIAMLPFISLGQTREYGRIGLEGVGYGHPNALAAWFGFCVIYLTIKGYIETRTSYRLAAWLMAVGSLYVVTLTVSRGALLGVAVSLFVASRRLLKVGLFPVLLLAVLVIGLFELGVFDEAIRAYTIRAEEDTGRLRIWPLLIEKFLNSPFIGNGVSNTGAFISSGKFITPHNGFLLLAVASGVVPILLFCAYFYRSGMAALRADVTNEDSMFYLPLVAYTLLITASGNLDFMTPWVIMSLAVSSTVRRREYRNCPTCPRESGT